MSAVGNIADTEAFLKASWSLFQHDGAAAFNLSERSPLPPPVSAKDLLGGRTQVSNVRAIRRINCHPVKSDVDRASDRLSDTDDCLHWNGDLDNPNDSEDGCAVDVEFHIEQGNTIDIVECPEQRVVMAAPHFAALIRPTWQSKRMAKKLSMTINAIETRRYTGVKKM